MKLRYINKWKSLFIFNNNHKINAKMLQYKAPSVTKIEEYNTIK